MKRLFALVLVSFLGILVYLNWNQIKLHYCISKIASDAASQGNSSQSQSFCSLHGFVNKDKLNLFGNREEDYLKNMHPKLGFFGGWSGIGVSTRDGASFVDYLRFFAKSSPTSSQLKFYDILNFSRPNRCFSQLIEQIQTAVPQFQLETIFIVITPDLLFSCDTNLSERRVSRLTDNDFYQMRQQIFDLRKRAENLNLDVVPIVLADPFWPERRYFAERVLFEWTTQGYVPILHDFFQSSEDIQSDDADLFLPNSNSMQRLAKDIVEKVSNRNLF